MTRLVAKMRASLEWSGARIFDGAARRCDGRLHRQRVHEYIRRSAFELIQKRPQRLQIHIKRSLKADRIGCVVALGSFSAG